MLLKFYVILYLSSSFTKEF